MPTPADLSIPLASLSDDANIEDAVNPALVRIAEIMAWQDQGARASRPAVSAALRGFRYLATDEGVEYLCTGTGWLQVGGVSRVTSLPSSPFDGQEVDFVADSANGVIWRLCYRAAASGAYKWEFVGGSSLFATGVGGSVNTTYVPLASCAVPVPGRYLVEAMAGLSHTDIISLRVHTGASYATDLGVFGSVAGNATCAHRRVVDLVGNLRMSAYTQSGTGTASSISLTAIPVAL